MSDAPWNVSLDLSDNCLCGMTQMYLDGTFMPRGMYTHLAFEALIEQIRPSKRTLNLFVNVDGNMAVQSDLDALHEALHFMPDRMPLVAKADVDAEADSEPAAKAGAEASKEELAEERATAPRPSRRAATTTRPPRVRAPARTPTPRRWMAVLAPPRRIRTTGLRRQRAIRQTRRRRKAEPTP